MRRFFEMDFSHDTLLSGAAERDRVKLIQELYYAIDAALLPRSEYLQLECVRLLDLAQKGEVPENEIRSVIANGIGWLSTHRIRNVSPLVDVFKCYWTIDKEETPEICSDLVDALVEEIRNIEPNYRPYFKSFANFSRDILDRWGNILNDQLACEVLRYIVVLSPIQIHIHYLDAIDFLKRIENQYIHEFLAE